MKAIETLLNDINKLKEDLHVVKCESVKKFIKSEIYRKQRQIELLTPYHTT